MDITKPYEFIRFGAMDVTKPYEFIRFGAMAVTKLSRTFIRTLNLDFRTKLGPGPVPTAPA